MEHVDNSMDDLFRKAGDLYPLKTSDSDWEGVLGKLRVENLGDQTSIPVINANGKSKKRRWGFLLLLIPIGLGSVIYFSSDRKKETAIPSLSNTPATASTKNKNLPVTKNDVVKSNLTIQKIIQSNIVPAQPATVKKIQHSGTSGSKTVHPYLTPDQETSVRASPEKNSNSVNSSAEGSGGKPVYAVTPATTPSPTPLTESKSDPATGPSSAPAGTAVTSIATDQKQPQSAPGNLPAKSVPKDTQSDQPTVKKVETNAKSQRRFYVGLLAGPDWSSVKFQSVKQTGFSFGALLGYRFSKRISVETGLILNKKFYYSDGEYFNVSKTGIPVNEPVNYLNGNCLMFEIPINFRYDFALGKNHSFFANAGLSSYLMKKETYSINFQGGTSAWYFPDTSYYNSTNNLFAVLQLSAGYERAISSTTNIRVEPYIKIPLQGIGIGNLPIASAGIYFGITYSFK